MGDLRSSTWKQQQRLQLSQFRIKILLLPLPQIFNMHAHPTAAGAPLTSKDPDATRTGHPTKEQQNVG